MNYKMEDEIFVKEELIKALREFEEKLLDNSKSFYKDLEEMGVSDYDFWKLLDKSWEDVKS
jgi:hypothetical protein